MAKKQVMSPALPPQMSKPTGAAKRNASKKTAVKPGSTGTKISGGSTSGTRGTIGASSKPAGGKATKVC